MKIKYSDSKIESICLEYLKAKKKFGEEVAQKLFAAIQFIVSAETLMDVRNFPSFNLHSLKGKRKGEYAIDLGRKLGFRLILIPLKENGQIWKDALEYDIYKTTKVVLILEVTNHYE